MSPLQRAFNVQHPIFKPLWRRIALVAACLGWAGLELYWANPGWAALFGAAGVYCAHQFFVAFDPDKGEDSDSTGGDDP